MSWFRCETNVRGGVKSYTVDVGGLTITKSESIDGREVSFYYDDIVIPEKYRNKEVISAIWEGAFTSYVNIFPTRNGFVLVSPYRCTLPASNRIVRVFYME